MTRTPRVPDTLRGKSLVYLSAGLALAGTGAVAAVAGFSTSPATAASTSYDSAAHAPAEQHGRPPPPHGRAPR